MLMCLYLAQLGVPYIGKLCYSAECVHFHIQNCAETLVNEL